MEIGESFRRSENSQTESWNAERRSPEENGSSGFRVSWKSNGVRKKKKGILEMLYISLSVVLKGINHQFPLFQIMGKRDSRQIITGEAKSHD